MFLVVPLEFLLHNNSFSNAGWATKQLRPKYLNNLWAWSLDSYFLKRHSFVDMGGYKYHKISKPSYLWHTPRKWSNANSSPKTCILSLKGTMSSSSSSCSAAPAGTSTVFEAGNYTTAFQRVEPVTCTTKSPIPVPPPKPLLICMPADAGQFPVLLLLHGYLLLNSFYSELMQHVTSHGFIVIAPQVPLFLLSPTIAANYPPFA